MFNNSTFLQRVTTPQMLFAGIFIYCVIMILVARFYFQGFLALEPCPLCAMQRFFVIGIALVALAAFIHNPGILGRKIYAGLAMLPNLAGILTASRHVWLQSLPPDQVPECGPGIDYIMEVFSLFEGLQMIFSGSGECAEIQWSLLGLTIPGWTLVAFVVMSVLLGYQLVRKD
jgi:disulfide bond formation protein DsbB